MQLFKQLSFTLKAINIFKILTAVRAKLNYSKIYVCHGYFEYTLDPISSFFLLPKLKKFFLHDDVITSCINTKNCLMVSRNTICNSTAKKFLWLIINEDSLNFDEFSQKDL